MEWVKSLFEIGKLPSNIVFLFAATSGALLFLPARQLASLHLDKLPDSAGFYIGLTFIGSVCLLAINLVLWVCKSVGGIFSRRGDRVRLIENLASLDRIEKAILREFYIEETNAIMMPINEPSVAGLVQKGILFRVGNLGGYSVAGVVLSLSINPAIRRVLTNQMLDLPNGQPTEAEIDRISSERPEFVGRMKRWDGLG